MLAVQCTALFRYYVPAIIVARNARRGSLGIVREKRPAPLRDDTLEQSLLLVDEQFWVALVTHRNRQVHPRRPWNEVPQKSHRPLARSFHAGKHQSGRVAFGIRE